MIELTEDLLEPLAEFGRRWAVSPLRICPSAASLNLWDRFLLDWQKTDRPLLLRDGRNRGMEATTFTGRKVIFADNTPANIVFDLALQGVTPLMEGWDGNISTSPIPLTFVTKGKFAKRCLNKAGWKICHIEPVSDRKRYKIENAPIELIEAEFYRFLSPRNMFLIPKELSGAGEIDVIVNAVKKIDMQRFPLSRE